MLEVKGLHVHYGAIAAVKGIDLRVPAGQIVALIGANGAGKSTTLRTISGLLKPTRGTITFAGKAIGGLRADKVVRAGLVQVPEGRQVLARMTVAENLLMGGFCRRDAAGVKADLEQVWGRFPRLAERRTQLAGTLSGGEQQMLAMGRALIARPRLLMLDEPSMGLAPLVVKEVLDLVVEINRGGTTVLLVEQNARQALAMATYAYVLETGKVALEGAGEELARDPRVIAAYLGGRGAPALDKQRAGVSHPPG
ncbi:MAG: livF 1 [Firmicutes bacterium]|nr:livF 1 [Bacillota bacterium]